MNAASSAWTGQRRYTVAYVLALSCIALLAGAIHFGESRLISQQRDSAEIINVAGRQRMLSQRISYLMLLEATDPATFNRYALGADLTRATEQMRSSHEELTQGRLVLSANSPRAAELDDLYFSEDGLDAGVRRFLAGALNAAPGQSSAINPGSLLEDLDRAVMLYQRSAEERIDRVHMTTRLAALGLLTLLLLEAVFIFRPLGRRLAAAQEELLAIATRDPLTGSHNRRGFMSAANSLLSYFARTGEPVGVITFDIDFLRRINDTYGHEVGDQVLRFVADVAVSNIRGSDLMGRIGGEEFAILCPNTGRDQCAIVAEKIRASLDESAFRGGNFMVPVTASFGVSAAVPDLGTLPVAFLEKAQNALRLAKEEGRNRVETASDDRTADDSAVA